jgi:hypothetical protein
MGFKFAPGGGGTRGAFDRLVTALSDDSTTQDLFREFLNSVAFKSDLGFLSLSDVPKSYDQSAGKPVVVAERERGLEFGEFSAGAETFLELTDTPDSYDGEASKVVSVKADESGLEFSTVAGGLGAYPYVKGGKATASGGTTISNSAWTSPDLNTSVFDSGSVVDLGANSLVAPEDGYYLVIFRFDITGDLTYSTPG